MECTRVALTLSLMPWAWATSVHVTHPVTTVASISRTYLRTATQSTRSSMWECLMPPRRWSRVHSLHQLGLIRRVRAQDSEESGGLLQLPERVLRVGVRHGGLEVDVEEVRELHGPGRLLRHRVGAHGPRFHLGEVDVTQREARQRLEERARVLLHAARNGGLVQHALARRQRLPRQRQEAGDVGRVVLDVFLQHLHAVQGRRAPGRHCRCTHDVVLRDVRRRTRRVVHCLLNHSHRCQVPVALGESLRMAHGALYVLLALPRQRQ
mmetsp:Transcript_23860/g.38371  ORF Transcript_23860/g.38371 Transcript_23860/m.38371 type:complete len:266 (-) Transcript_23860:679-1476(-)